MPNLTLDVRLLGPLDVDISLVLFMGGGLRGDNGFKFGQATMGPIRCRFKFWTGDYGGPLDVDFGRVTRDSSHPLVRF